MARYFRVSISSTNTNGPFDIFYNTSEGGVLSFATLYPSGGNATNLSKSLFIGGNTVSVQVPDNVFSIQVVQQSPYVVSTIYYPIPLTPAPTTAAPTTAPTTAAPTTTAPTTAAPTTAAPTTAAPTTASPTTAAPTTAAPTTASPTTAAPTTAAPTTAAPTTSAPTTAAPTTASPTTASPTTAAPTTAAPTTAAPTTAAPTTASPTTAAPTTAAPTTAAPTTAAPTTAAPTTAAPTTAAPTTAAPTTPAPTIPPTGVSCYNIFFTSYTIGECYSYPNEYESMQTVGIELSGSSIVDINISGSLTDGTPFNETIPAGYNGTYIIANRSCGCYVSQCLTGNGIQDITVTAYSGSVVIPDCGAQPNQFIALFPTGTLFLNNVTTNCNANQVYFNLTGGIAPYSASVTQDANGNPIWTYTNIPTTYTASVTANQPYYPAIADSTGTVVTWQTLYECITNEITFILDPLNSNATGQLTQYIYVLPNPAVNRNSPFTATGSYGGVINMGATGTSGSTFLGWSYNSGSKASIFSTESIIQIPFTGTGSVIYALIEKNSVSSSFCYYDANPIGTTVCDTCAVTKSIYFNANSLTGSDYTNVTWYKDENLSTLADAGYYKLVTNPGISTPIYQVSAGPTQTRTLTGFCSDSTLTC